MHLFTSTYISGMHLMHHQPHLKYFQESVSYTTVVVAWKTGEEISSDRNCNLNPHFFHWQKTRTTLSTAKMKLISLLLWITFFKLLLPSFTKKQLLFGGDMRLCCRHRMSKMEDICLHFFLRYYKTWQTADQTPGFCYKVVNFTIPLHKPHQATSPHETPFRDMRSDLY